MRPIFPALSSPPSYTAPLTTPDGFRLFTQGWLPDASPRATVVIVHGYAEHSSRYLHVAPRLSRSGYAVHTFDQRGYGRSQGRRAYVEAFDQYVSDLAFFVKTKAFQEPLFLLAHSMGGTVSLCYALQHHPDLEGLVLSAPALRVTRAPRWLQRLATPLSKALPTLPITRTPDRTRLARDPQVITHARQDAFFYSGRMRARTGSELLRAARYLQRHAEDLHLPFLLLQGTADRIVNPEGGIELYQRASSADKTLHVYEGAYHEILNDLDKEEALGDITAWLEEHTSACKGN